ncbi:hypothetical protein KSD_72730 [Ktedonobacter sp. SOSP1-85]|uniref:hypothetical protein n=1 Tax=Ktedonobacter sp. SOSP1-85 TaxID=2778367 RepID=UPI001914EA21|nr:hypothetical protein [Ktedonobacter sp. SOSP1-85]GHO79502.1 hypothetical protein KSD_72730 [Ktedonobacter sp. SOSP1-85]
MSTNTVGWTAPIASAKVHADPSGVQQASTNFQALLLPGMSTVTPRLRYISLFTAARFYRMEAGRTEEKQIELEQQLSLDEYFRRFEALVAVCTIHHHLRNDAPPNGIVGLRAMRGRLQSQEQTIELKSGVQNPPRNIYRGTLSNLRIFDTSEPSDPLFEHAIGLGKAWDIERAGQLGLALKEGFLPRYINREDIAKIDGAFCLCSIPDNSPEQDELIRVLFAKGQPLQISSLFASDNEMIEHTASYRSLAWRFVLELIDQNQGQPLGNYLTLINLLDKNAIIADRHPALKDEMIAWRWVAARTFFERGWTGLFQKSIEILKQKQAGLSTSEFKNQMQQFYLNQHQDETIESLYQAVETNTHDKKDWLKGLFKSEKPRDFLLCILFELYTTKRDMEVHQRSFLSRLWSADPIAFSKEDQKIERNHKASELWSEIAEQSLLQHFSISLRKMSEGNPDSLLIDFDAGKWGIRDIAFDIPIAQAEGFTRLDIAFSWALQLGLAKRLPADALELTSIGRQCCRVWDHGHQ